MTQQPTTRAEPIGKRLSLSLGIIAVSIAYALWQDLSGSAPVVAQAVGAAGQPQAAAAAPAANAAPNPNQGSPAAKTLAVSAKASRPPAAAPATAATPAPAPAAPQTPTGQYKDGSYTGSAVDAYYGTVQVQAIIKSGSIADVQFLQYPNDRGNSISVNSYAMPLLTQEAVQAQSAQVDGVSGATFTSQAFAESLASALAQAKA